MKIYTRTGDSGETGLFDGTRVSKADPRVAAYGDVDELNAWLGLALAAGIDQPAASADAADASRPTASPTGDLAAWIEQIQRDLFAVGARLADPRRRIAARVEKAVLEEDAAARLEGWIDALESELPPLRKFILAGGSPAGAALHVARTVCRRAERAVVSLRDADPDTIVYLNRLSDLLFVMARAVNHRAGAPEREW